MRREWKEADKATVEEAQAETKKNHDYSYCGESVSGQILDAPRHRSCYSDGIVGVWVGFSISMGNSPK